MDRNQVLGMVCGYYLSRFDDSAYARLGHSTQRATHEWLGAALGVRAKSIKGWRDEFDPVHDNSRKGWWNREMFRSRRRTIEVLGEWEEGELSALVMAIVKSPTGPHATQVVRSIVELDDGDDKEDGAYGLRGPTGRKAEEAFQEYHLANGHPIRGRLIDRRYQQCGFDFEIENEEGSAYVEVKGMAGGKGGITFTDKEWTTARAKGSAYCLAVVRHVATKPEVSLIENPGRLLDPTLRTYTTLQVDWAVPHKVLQAAVAPEQ